MNTALTTNTPEAIGSYFSLYREILTASHYVCLNTGKHLTLNLEKKVLWCWMVDRFQFFKNKNKDFFDNQADIAAASGVSESTVKRFLAELTDAKDKNGKHKGAGYISITCTRKIGGHKSNSYVLLCDLVLIQPDKALNKPTAAKAQKPKITAAPALQSITEENHIPAGQDWTLEQTPFVDDEPDWVVASLTDDGSTADAFTYANTRDSVGEIPPKNDDQPKNISAQTQKKENELAVLFPNNLPEKRFNPNGMPSREMLNYCKQYNIKMNEQNGSTVFVIDGEEYTISLDGFVPYVASEIAVNSDGDFWANLNEPF